MIILAIAIAKITIEIYTLFKLCVIVFHSRVEVDSWTLFCLVICYFIPGLRYLAVVAVFFAGVNPFGLNKKIQQCVSELNPEQFREILDQDILDEILDGYIDESLRDWIKENYGQFDEQERLNIIKENWSELSDQLVIQARFNAFGNGIYYQAASVLYQAMCKSSGKLM